MRGFKHGFLERQFNGRPRHVGVANRRRGGVVGQAQADIFIGLDIRRLQTRTNRAPGAVDAGTGVFQVADRGVDRVLLRLLGQRVFVARDLQRLAQLADGVQRVLALVVVAVDDKLVARLRCSSEVKLDPERTAVNSALGNRLAVGAQRLGIHLVLGGAGKFDHRAIARKAVAIGLGVGHRGTGNLRSRAVARRARGIDGVGLGLQGEGTPRHCRIAIRRRDVLEIGGNVERNAAQADALRTVLGRVEHAITRHLRGQVVAVAVSQGVLGAAAEFQRIGLAFGEALVEHRA